MAKGFEQLDNAQFQEKLKKILETGPLYREYRYRGANGHQLPNEITLYCDGCLRDTPWIHSVNRSQFSTDRAPNTQRKYTCTNCNKKTLHFCFNWLEWKEAIEGQHVQVFSFTKYGQFPPLEERLSKELEKALKPTEDLDFYKTALRDRNFGEGIGAMAYMRRIVENHMTEMLEILNDEAVGKGMQPIKDEIKSLRFDEKIDRAKELFPAIIMPENYPNPFEQLYRLTSDGLHNLSEDESIVLFDQCRNVFEYVFSELRPHLGNRKKFLEDLQSLPKLGSSALEKQAPKSADAQKAG